jgi:octaprenyl-diphosphate synthase
VGRFPSPITVETVHVEQGSKRSGPARKGAVLSVRSGLSRVERVQTDPLVTPRAITTLIADELIEVEELLLANLGSSIEIVGEIGASVAESPGKRVRPTLHLLAARLCGYTGPHDVLLATVLEFIHSATLIHDDIIDEATTRRGQPSLNARWGNDLTVLFGDYMFAKAMEMALRAGSLEVMQRLADVTLRMTEGEMQQTRYVGRIDLSVEEYLELIRRKTAALFACCCELAGLLARVDETRQSALRRYGLSLGMAFQLVDDLLDFTGDEKTLGKPAASDLREGKATLAVLDLLRTGSVEARRLVQGIMDDGEPDPTRTARLTELLRESGAIERSHRMAREYAAAAAEQLDRFEDSEARRALLSLPELLVQRDR